jgi:hypothetical protein
MMASRYDKGRVPHDQSSIAPAGDARSALGPSAMSHEDDFSLIRRVAAKDRQAFESLYQRYYLQLMGYLVKFLGRRELAEDVVHEVMVVVWNEASRFRYTSLLSTWLFGIAYYKAWKAQAKTAEQPLDMPPVAHRAGPSRSRRRHDLSGDPQRAGARFADLVPGTARGSRADVFPRLLL